MTDLTFVREWMDHDPTPEEIEWLEARKAAALQIDPETAQVMWAYIWDFDPYGLYANLPEELRQAGRGYFARDPGSDIWVEFGDLPKAVGDQLWEKHGTKLSLTICVDEDDHTYLNRNDEQRRSSSEVVLPDNLQGEDELFDRFFWQHFRNPAPARPALPIHGR
jgi:hypothetical protein